ncbi:MAG: GTPase RsgA [Dermatophilaceae bacterium]|nr:GTPase RsgA [Intrasporangiaceae bacterium]
MANLLLGRGAAPTGQVRPGDHRGRHVTSSRGRYALPTGGVIIDTPGLRSLALTIDRGGVSAAFPDIETLASDCRFADCRHEHEPDCVVPPPSMTASSTGLASGTSESSGDSSTSTCGVTIRSPLGRTGRSGRSGARPPDGSAMSAATESPQAWKTTSPTGCVASSSRGHSGARQRKSRIHPAASSRVTPAVGRTRRVGLSADCGARGNKYPDVTGAAIGLWR